MHVCVNSYRTAAGRSGTAHGSAGTNRTLTASERAPETGLQGCCLEVSSHFTREGKRVLRGADNSPKGTPLGRGAFSQVFRAQASARDVSHLRTPITHVCNNPPPPRTHTHNRTLAPRTGRIQHSKRYCTVVTAKTRTLENLIS